MSDEREIVRRWEGGHSEKELAYVFGVSRLEVRKIVRAQKSFAVGRQIHRAMYYNRRLTRNRKVTKRIRQFEETRATAEFYTLSHEIQGLRALYHPGEKARLRRILKREGTPT